MAYWHMQLHPDDKGQGREKELLGSEIPLIGLGDYWDGGDLPILQFQNEMALEQ